jgi:hypothetical protein
MITIFAGRRIVAAFTKESASSAIISKSPALASGIARVPAKFRRANAVTGSEQQCDVHMQLDR